MSFGPQHVESDVLTRPLCSFKMGNDPDRLPCSKFLENKRYMLFTHGDWPHDKTKGHAVTSRKVCFFPPYPCGLLSDNPDCWGRVSIYAA